MNHDTDTPGNELPQDEQVSQAYQSLGKETTPPALDEHILAAARREVSSRPHKISFSRRWAVPVSVAAVIVLSVSLFTMHQVRIPMTTALAPALESVPATSDSPAATRMEQQEVRTDSVETKQEPLLKQRSIASPMKADIPEADVQQDKDSAVSGAIMFETSPILKKEKAITPAPERISDSAVPVEEQLATIRQLLKEGKQEEALSALNAFRERYPDYPLSNDLKKLLE